MKQMTQTKQSVRVHSTRKNPFVTVQKIFIIAALLAALKSSNLPPASALGQTAVLVGAGDISSCENDNDAKTATLLDDISGTVFTTGDNVYDTGKGLQFLFCFNFTWGWHKDRIKPVPGNHDYITSGASGYYNYFNVPEYYAYNRGDWRIYALNSEIDAAANSEQVTWLKNDLADNPRKCVMAYWHRPRWSSGSHHGSDTRTQALWDVLFDAHAELVVTGHEHNYERFAPMNKTGQVVEGGLQEFVVGTGGMELYGFGPVVPGSMVRNGDTYGVLKLTLKPGSYEWEFIPIEGQSFTDSGSRNCH
jgi:hypothetical protein